MGTSLERGTIPRYVGTRVFIILIALLPGCQKIVLQLLPQDAPGLAFFFDPQWFELTRANPFSPQSIKVRCQIPRFWWSYGGPESGTKTDVVSRGGSVKMHVSFFLYILFFFIKNLSAKTYEKTLWPPQNNCGLWRPWSGLLKYQMIVSGYPDKDARRSRVYFFYKK